MSINADMDAAIVELANSIDVLAIATDRTQQARQAEASAANRVNNAQKRIDELVASLKKLAPYNSDWRNQTIKGEPG